MASNNTLLGSGKPEVKEVVKEKEVVGKPITVWMYHEDCRLGKIFYTDIELEDAIEDGWVDTPAKLKPVKVDNNKLADI